MWWVELLLLPLPVTPAVGECTRCGHRFRAHHLPQDLAPAVQAVPPGQPGTPVFQSPFCCFIKPLLQDGSDRGKASELSKCEPRLHLCGCEVSSWVRSSVCVRNGVTVEGASCESRRGLSGGSISCSKG